MGEVPKRFLASKEARDSPAKVESRLYLRSVRESGITPELRHGRHLLPKAKAIGGFQFGHHSDLIRTVFRVDVGQFSGTIGMVSDMVRNQQAKERSDAGLGSEGVSDKDLTDFNREICGTRERRGEMHQKHSVFISRVFRG